MLDQTTLNDYDLLNLVRDNQLEPKEISKERWNLNFARSFLNRVYIKKIPKGVLSEEEQVQLYGHISRAFYQLEEPCYRVCELAVNRDAESIRKISNPTEKVILTALEKDALLLLSCPHIQTNKRFREFGKREFERSVSRFECFQEKIKTPKPSFSEDLNLLSAFNTKDFFGKDKSIRLP